MDIAAFLALLACALGFGAWLVVREDDDQFRNPPRFSALTPPPFGSAEGPRAVDLPPAGAGPTSQTPGACDCQQPDCCMSGQRNQAPGDP